MSSKRLDVAEMGPRPIHARPAGAAAPRCPDCGCAYVIERRGVVRCVYCGRPRPTEAP